MNSFALFLKELLRAVSLVACTAILAYVTYILGTTYLKHTALQECYFSAHYTYTDKNAAEITEPVRAIYKSCVTDKGYTTSLE